MKKIIAVAFLTVFIAPFASAHTISIGSFNAGAPGSVTLVMGTYSHGSGIAQGSMQLIAGPSGVPSAVVAMGPLLLSKPAGLVDGDNNFYADCGGSPNCSPGSPDAYNDAVNNTGLTVVNWQGATFSGLTVGVYTYQLTGMVAANWRNWNSTADANWTGTLTITGTSVGVPEPGTLALFGIGLAGLGFVSRRRRRSA